MPYIKTDNRIQLNYVTNELDSIYLNNPGDLNYLVTCLCNKYIDNNTLSYQTINDIVGALEGAKLEFYRRIAAPYEKIKMKENGDVY